MNCVLRYKKIIAVFFLLLLTTELLLPNAVQALTTGPSQPEMQGFEPAGTADMVDLFSGDFTYNIPLLDVGGYPVNMAYNSGSGMDDEASWVGLGWTLNPGAVNRQMRGIPDDFEGDKVVREFNMKDDNTYGATALISPELFGFGKLNVKLSVGVFKNTYRGMGSEVGLSGSFGLTKNGAGSMTIGVNSNSQTGASANASVNFSVKEKAEKDAENLAGVSVGMGYNSRSGITGLTLSGSGKGSANLAKKGQKPVRGQIRGGSVSSFISFAGETHTLSNQQQHYNESYTFTPTIGPALWAFHTKLGLTGYYHRQSISNKVTTLNAYGFLRSEKGRKNNNSLLDFNREKDIPYHNSVPNLPVPVPQADIFVASSQDGSSQFRSFRNGSGIFADPGVKDESISLSGGVEVGMGSYFQAGADLYLQNVRTYTNKWTAGNGYLGVGDFQDENAEDPLFEPSYIKRVGESVMVDEDYVNALGGYGPVRVDIGISKGETSTNKVFRKKNEETLALEQQLKRHKREGRNQLFSYLTAREADHYGLETAIRSYKKNEIIFPGQNENNITLIPRVNAHAKPHHISEITVKDNGGKRLVYGIPAYNTHQEDVNFSIEPGSGDPVTGLAPYTPQNAGINNKSGREGYFNKESMPPFAHSFLLTGMLSDDYVDATGNGISDDDRGSAVKFNYTRMGEEFKWRTPYAQMKANLNEGSLSDTRDDKASYSYGSKETWYVHSIESKTMIAYFFLGDREDGLGVKNEDGEKDAAVKLQYLDRIELYSKSDLQAGQANAVPIKTVHFEYDYSTCPNVPNNSGAVITKNGENINALKGKLTLRKVFFTFGKNKKGFLHPYTFNYNSEINGQVIEYEHKQTDRWGVYKKNTDNPSQLRNDEYPYTLQDPEKSDAYAGLWQLSSINLPSGGTQRINYEADNYGFVQDKRAGQMCMMSGIDQKGKATGLIRSNEILVKLPRAVNSEDEMRFRYFKDMTQLYFKFYVDLDNKGHYEYVPCYGKIQRLRLIDPETAAIELEKTEGVHPGSLAAWQTLRMSLPMYAYPGSETANEPSDFKAAIQSLGTAITNYAELVENFNAKAKRLALSDRIDLSRSFVRLCQPDISKSGGGSRVKSVRLTDNWQVMSGNSVDDATYGQDYLYTTTIQDHNNKPMMISSGVAAYEPMIGNDENPLRQPIYVRQDGAPLSLNYYYYIEQPVGESFYPGPSVGYSKVTVRSVGADNSTNRTGYTTNEFYTARDFPVIVEQLGMDAKREDAKPLLALLKIKNRSALALSQGYSVRLNDMHGKPKGSAVFNRMGAKISSVDYTYKTENPLATAKKLDNSVMLLHPDGSFKNGRIGEDMELFTDMREQATTNNGYTVNFSFGTFPVWILVIPYVMPGVGYNKEYKEFRSASTVKVWQQFGVLQKVTKTENGSTVVSENIAWDPATGEVLLTKTQNEFDDPLYALNYPAYWAYDGMAPAFRNENAKMSSFVSDAQGAVLTAPAGLFAPGDEVISLSEQKKGWITKNNTGNGLKIVDKDGKFLSITGPVRIVRSGRRNLQGAFMGALTTLRNPIKAGKLDPTVWTQVIEAKSNTFKEEWPVNIPYLGIPDDPYENLKCPKDYITGMLLAIGHQDLAFNRNFVSQNERDTLNSQYLFAGPNSNITLKDLVNKHKSFGSSPQYDEIGNLMTDPFFKGENAANLRFYVNTPRSRTYCGRTYYYFNRGDTITVGENIIIIQEIHPYFNDGINGYFSPNNGNDFTRTGNENYGSASPCGCEAGLRYRNSFFRDYTLINTVFKDISIDHTGCTIGELCIPAFGEVVNPYRAGLLGNWRNWQQYIYHVDRKEEVHAVNTATGATNIRRAGAYESFTAFWNYDAFQQRFVSGGTADKLWVAGSEVTRYNSKGVEVENVDALNRYGAALYGYLESTPVAIANNARYTDIGYDGFEDYLFRLAPGIVKDSCNTTGHFDFRLQQSKLSTAAAHTGRFSIQTADSIVMLRAIPDAAPAAQFYSYDALGQFMLSAGNTYGRFHPQPGSRYVASVWVKNPAVNSRTEGILEAWVNNKSTALAASSGTGPVVEGWRKVEVVFTVPQGAAAFRLVLNPKGGTAWFDDIRIHPFNSQLRSYVYNASNMFLMAELDENNYATFFEYDDEGTLIRVKKETERGIMTLKENRSTKKMQ